MLFQEEICGEIKKNANGFLWSRKVPHKDGPTDSVTVGRAQSLLIRGWGEHRSYAPWLFFGYGTVSPVVRGTRKQIRGAN